MKKFLLSIAVITAAICANAQGTWKATGTEASVAGGTEMVLGVPSLKAAPSDPAGTVGKTDTGAPVSTYSGVTYDNQAIFQGNTNGMYFAFLPSKGGRLDVAVKMGTAKKTFVLALKDEIYATITSTVGDIAALTSKLPNFTDLTAANYTLPSVFDTYNNTTGTWDNSTAIQSSGANQYLVMSFPVLANKTYVVGVTGSKLMLRGVTLTTTTNVTDMSESKLNVFPNPASGKVFVDVKEAGKIGIYNLAGSLMKQQTVSSSQNAINISDLRKGIYFIKDMKNSQVQKLIVQ